MQDETIALISWFAAVLQDLGPKSGIQLKSWDAQSGTMKVFIGEPLNKLVDVAIIVRGSQEAE